MDSFTPQYFYQLAFLNETNSLTYAIAFLTLFTLTGGLIPFFFATATTFVLTIIINRFIFNRRSQAPSNSALIITGCSTGIGLALALDYSTTKNSTVFATVRKQSDADNILTLFKATPTPSDMKRGELVPIIMDVDSIQSIEDAVMKIDEICINKNLILISLLNNAGYGISSHFELLSPERLRAQFQTNVFGLTHVTNAVLPILRRAVFQLKADQNSTVPSVVNFGSIASTLSFSPLGAYTASKYAVKSLSECYKHELSGMGINVVTICPGAVKTNFYNTLAKSQIVNKTVVSTTTITTSSDSNTSSNSNSPQQTSQERYINPNCPVEPEIQEYYHAWAKSHAAGTEAAAKFAFSSDSITRIVWDVILSPRPHAHYHTGPDALFLAPVVKWIGNTGLLDIAASHNRPKLPLVSHKKDD